MHGKIPTKDMLELLLKAKTITHDMYIIGSQECQKSIAASMFAPSKEKFERMLVEYLGDNYVMVCSHALGAIHLTVFISKYLTPIISGV